MVGQRDVDADQLLDLVLSRGADLEALRDCDLCARRHLADPVRLLLPEAESPPSVEQLGVVRRNEGGVARVAPLDPGRGGERVEVADVLGRSTAWPAASTQTFSPHTFGSRGAPIRYPARRPSRSAAAPEAPSARHSSSISTRAAAGSS